MRLAKQRHPVIIELKAEATPVRVKQYPMSQEARQGITPHIRRLMDAGILKQCQSPWNTPLLPLKKPGSTDYRPVQDLREVNKRSPTIPSLTSFGSTRIPPSRRMTKIDGTEIKTTT
ncbi:hypothetical protein FD754_024723 [Muntiacus muntjak]|uniref:Reverse transcriptase domain-containing protein n=1 Tax=Muntiacus muntjak TaxID=9888 RepID=A0A5N3UNL8_MUNMU|nr:hypothetical protein FD754_024724 [Muntiacus muntjak]KAB0338232.1 hypothetical protein FD754_024723 [Muntiacus muntjak]